MEFEIAVVGGGPAGLAAAIQARQRGRSVVVVGGDRRDGALSKTEHLENYPGLPQSSGAELLERFEAHAQAMGAQSHRGRVLNIVRAGERFFLGVGSDVIEAKAVVLAPGVARPAKFPGEERFLGRGVSYCATCDGMLYRGKEVVVVGKAAEAPEEAAFLQGLGCQVRYVAAARPAELDGEIPFFPGDRVEILGEKRVEAVQAGAQRIPCEGVFILRPAIAPAELVPGLELRDGYVAVDRRMATNIEGLFAAGDCTGQPLQLAKAVGEGQVAGHSAAEYVQRMARSQTAAAPEK